MVNPINQGCHVKLCEPMHAIRLQRWAQTYENYILSDKQHNTQGCYFIYHIDSDDKKFTDSMNKHTAIIILKVSW